MADRWIGSNGSWVHNITYVHNTTMVTLDLTSRCGTENGTTSCKEQGLGISLSTPILMMSSGLLGNILALVVLYTSKKDVKKTVFYILLAGLAWTDLIGHLMTGPMAIIVYANNLKWVGGNATCVYHAFVMICFAVVTPMLVCLMSLDRLVALQFSFFYARTFTKKKARIVIVVCWLIVLLFGSLPLVGFGSYEQQFPGSWCFLNFHRESEMDIAYATIFAVINILVITLNLVCNIIVVVTLMKMRKKRIIQNSPSIERRHGAARLKSQKRVESETQMVVFLCAITLAFSICHLPLNVSIIINQITGVRSNKMDLLSIRLASINQILDPWLYILLRRRLIFKIAKHIKNLVCGAGIKMSPSKHSKSQYSYDNHASDRAESYVIGSQGNHELKVICDNNSDSEECGTGSGESLGSTSNLLPGSNDEVKVIPTNMQRSISADDRPSHVTILHNSEGSDTDTDMFNEDPYIRTSLKMFDQKLKMRSPRRLSQDRFHERPKVLKRLNSSPAKLDCL